MIKNKRAEILIKTLITIAYVGSRKSPSLLVNVTPPMQPKVCQPNSPPQILPKNTGIKMRICLLPPSLAVSKMDIKWF